ncbi:DNA alkylation repair protein [Anaerovorax odorimutans]|uniref:DNA alkylation repair protein n=1 Tax=Anaerovorax odorimutans TaxID=109327 RepID=UPI0003FFD2BA|nr:DNA alkylation repair protein [Anaerovorax odorimutans]
MKNKIRKKLTELVDEKYKKFHSGLIPGINNLLGVRIPDQRKIAKEMVKGDWKIYLDKNLIDYKDEYYEEIMIQGLIIGNAKMTIGEMLKYTADFIPKINNWGICDSFCSSLKKTKKHRKEVWEFLQPYLKSNKIFEIRFGVVMLLDYYIVDDYIDQVLITLDIIKNDGYYVKMAVAWALSVCYVKYPEKTIIYLNNNNLDDFTYNKALQKIIESLRVDKDSKDLIRSMKRS